MADAERHLLSMKATTKHSVVFGGIFRVQLLQTMTQVNCKALVKEKVEHMVRIHSAEMQGVNSERQHDQFMLQSCKFRCQAKQKDTVLLQQWLALWQREVGAPSIEGCATARHAENVTLSGACPEIREGRAGLTMTAMTCRTLT